MSLYKRGKIWWTQYTINGCSVRKSTRHTDKKLAQKEAERLKNSQITQIENGKTLADALKVWLLERDRSYSEKSSIREFLKFYPSRPLSQVNGFDIQDALAIKTAANYNRIGNIIRAAINMAVEREWCNPIKITRRKIVKKPPRFLTQEEWQRLELALPPHLKAMAQFAISTGLRKSNVLGLRWQNVDMNRQVAWVEGTESKSGKPIPVPLSDNAMAALKSQLDKHEEYVFTYKGEPVLDIKTAFKKALARAEVKNFRWHDFRHTWASWHVMQGTPLAVLKDLGGWHDISMVMIYAHFSPDHLTKYANNSIAVQKLC